MQKILITGGAGFIGTHITPVLLKNGYLVRILDPLNPQVHGALPCNLDWLGSPNVEFIRGSVNNRADVILALTDIEHVIHLAAETGTGQSMYEIERYFHVNVQGTAVMLEAIQSGACGQRLKSLVVASSRAIYGEGAYTCEIHGTVYPSQRTRIIMECGKFEPYCPHCDGKLCLAATPESSQFSPMSIYGLTKQVQEQAVLMFARTRGINGFGLRYQNVYGPGQSLKNPYTGILAVFSNLARQNQTIEIYEDGLESRDFVYIDDVVDATVRCINFGGEFVGALNVGSGIATSVRTVAAEVKAYFNSNSLINVTGAFRLGDIRHSIADITKIQRLLGFNASVSFSDGLRNFLKWASEQPVEDKAAYLRSVSELSAKGLMGQRAKQ